MSPGIRWNSRDAEVTGVAPTSSASRAVITPEDTGQPHLHQLLQPVEQERFLQQAPLTYPRQLIQYRDFLKDGGEIYFQDRRR